MTLAGTTNTIPSLAMWVLVSMMTAGLTCKLRADTIEKPSWFSIEAGGAFPTSANNYSDSQQAGFMGGAQYIRSLSPSWGIGGQAEYFHFGPKDRLVTNADGSQVSRRSTDNVGTVEVMGRYNLLPDDIFMPYVQTGVGFTYFHQKADGQPVDGAAWTDTKTRERRTLQDEGTLGFAYSVGIGVETQLTRSLILGLESAWHVFGVSKSTFGTSLINVPSVSLRLGWRFGSQPPAPTPEEP